MRLWLLTLVVSQLAWGGADNRISLSAEQIEHLGIRTAKPETVAALPLARVPGRVVLPPAKEFVVSATQAGVLANVAVPVGSKVTHGQSLATLRSSDLLAVQKVLLDAAATFQLSQARLKRDETLLKEGVIPRLRWQETQGDFDKASSALNAAEQTLLAAGFAQVDLNRLKTSRHLDSALAVRSPVDGVVLERMAVVGQRVDLLAPLFRIGQLDELWLELDMPQERLYEVRAGDQVLLETPKASARVIEVGQNVNPQNQSALVRAKVDSGIYGLRPGMNVNVQLMHNSTDLIVRMPSAALVSREGKSYVFVRTAAGFEAREIAVAGQEVHSVVIHEGIKNGETVAVQGVVALKAAWLGMGEGE